MPYLLSLFTLLFLLSACSSSKLGSLGEDDESVIQPSEENPVSEALEPEVTENPETELQDHVRQELDNEGRKIKEIRGNAKIIQKIGIKNFDKEKDGDSSTIIAVNQNIEEEGKGTVRVTVGASDTELEAGASNVEVTVDNGQVTVATGGSNDTSPVISAAAEHIGEAEAAERGPAAIVTAEEIPEKKFDLLFYIETRKSPCLKTVRTYANNYGFMEHLEEGLHWQVAFSFYSTKANLIPLAEYNNGQNYNSGTFWKRKTDYVLDKWSHDTAVLRKKLFVSTLKEVNVSPNMRSGSSLHNKNPNHDGSSVQDFLAGLNKILNGEAEGFIREDSKVVVLIFGWDFSFYTAQEWEEFFTKHKDVSFIVAASRKANNSNIRALDSGKYDFQYVPACEYKKSPERLIKAIRGKVI